MLYSLTHVANIFFANQSPLPRIGTEPWKGTTYAFLSLLSNLYSNNVHWINDIVITSVLAFGRGLFYVGKIFEW